jgi:hypothetical protein
MMAICGSGKLITRAIKKYGIENFEKEILLEADSSEEMFAKERELVELGGHSYNLKQGGYRRLGSHKYWLYRSQKAHGEYSAL